MKIKKIDESNLGEAVSFVSRLNQDLTHKIGYFGETGAEIKDDFSILQPPDGYGFVATSDEGQVIGFFGIEMDLELGRSWLLGPLVDEQDWDTISEQLYQAITADLPPDISNQELYFHGQNVRLENFALRHGFSYHAQGAVLILDVNQRQTRNVTGIIVFDERYVSQLETLHNDLFPNTYYSAEQLIKLDKEDDKCLLICQKKGNLVGYIFVQLRPASQDVYIDFLGVDQEHRQQGIAQDLVAQAVDWAVQKPYVERISLTVSGDNEAAIKLYHSMGFITQTVSRSYRKQT